MRVGAKWAWIALALVCGSSPALSQPGGGGADPEIARAKTDFQYGNYAEALKRASERIDRGNLSDAELIELHKYAGLSAFYLKQKPEAQRHLWALLQLEPDYSLDPFVVPPPAIAFFDALRKERAGQLDQIREERRRRAERIRETQERERARVEAEQQRRQLEELARQAARVRPQNLAVNFLPFGAGQFQQGRTNVGIIFAATEGVLALTSIAAYFAYDSLLREQSITLDERLTPDGTYMLSERGIPTNPIDRRHQAIVWRNVKYISGGAFWVTYAVGVIDALIHHKSQLVLAPPPAEQQSSQGAALPALRSPGMGIRF